MATSFFFLSLLQHRVAVQDNRSGKKGQKTSGARRKKKKINFDYRRDWNIHPVMGWSWPARCCSLNNVSNTRHGAFHRHRPCHHLYFHLSILIDDRHDEFSRSLFDLPRTLEQCLQSNWWKNYERASWLWSLYQCYAYPSADRLREEQVTYGECDISSSSKLTYDVFLVEMNSSRRYWTRKANQWEPLQFHICSY